MDIAKRVTPMPGYLTITPKEVKQEVAGIELPDSTNAKEKPELGTVVAQGAALDVMGRVKDLPEVVVGKVIAYKKYMGHAIKIGTEEVRIVAFDDVLGVVEL